MIKFIYKIITALGIKASQSITKLLLSYFQMKLGTIIIRYSMAQLRTKNDASQLVYIKFCIRLQRYGIKKTNWSLKESTCSFLQIKPRGSNNIKNMTCISISKLTRKVRLVAVQLLSWTCIFRVNCISTCEQDKTAAMPNKLKKLARRILKIKENHQWHKGLRIICMLKIFISKLIRERRQKIFPDLLSILPFGIWSKQ